MIKWVVLGMRCGAESWEISKTIPTRMYVHVSACDSEQWRNERLEGKSCDSTMPEPDAKSDM